jgi:hypothetical protein
LTDEPQQEIRRSEDERHSGQFGAGACHQQHEHDEGMLYKEHVPRDRLAWVPSGVPPEDPRDQSCEQGRQRQGVSDAAD